MRESACMYVCMYVCIYLSIHPSIHPSIHLSIDRDRDTHIDLEGDSVLERKGLEETAAVRRASVTQFSCVLPHVRV